MRKYLIHWASQKQATAHSHNLFTGPPTLIRKWTNLVAMVTSTYYCSYLYHQKYLRSNYRQWFTNYLQQQCSGTSPFRTPLQHPKLSWLKEMLGVVWVYVTGIDHMYSLLNKGDTFISGRGGLPIKGDSLSFQWYFGHCIAGTSQCPH